MAVIEAVSHYPTDRLIRKHARKHYRVPVRSQHWQLRSLISADKHNIVYFPGGNGSNHVQRLNTETHECETIKLLSFSPRCLTAENGWVCCGGETGEFTAIQLDEGGDANDIDMPLDLGTDPRLPRDAEAARSDTIFSIIAQSRRLNSRLNKNLMAKSQKLARDRVNCITLWFPPAHMRTHEGAYDEPVAVLANNDKSVVLVGLRDFETQEKTEPLDVITYPDYVNRAIISPDGRLLIAILDDPYLYVHERVEKPADDQGSISSKDKVEYHWEQCGKFLLQSQRQDDTSDSRGSFAACFSRSGAYLAVGTQYGTISVFDTTGLTGKDFDPCITSFKSSRPMTGSGAIRDMAFCPGPYDLLAWTEDRGHVGIADVRSGFIQRQILDIDAEDFEHITILDRNTIDPRLLEGRGERSDALASNLSSSLSLSDGRRRRGADGLERHPYPLTPDETRVLEALQDERRRREQRDRIAARIAEPGTSNMSPLPQLPMTPWGGRLPPQADTTDDTGPRTSRERDSSMSRALRDRTRERDQLREQSTSVSRAIGDLLGNIRDHRERAQERVRSAQRVLMESEAARERRQVPPPPRRPTSTRPGEALAALGRTSSGPRATTNAMYGGTPAPAGVWADVESLYNLSFESNLYDSRTTDGPSEESFLPYIAHAGHVSARARWDDGAAVRRRTVTDHGVHESPPEPDNTAGISWSDDGRVLFVGAENGIYEFHVDVQGRKYYPNITMR